MLDFTWIECIVYDFDGVMTDNRCLVDENGVEAVFVNRGDGYAIARIREMGIYQAILSTEKKPVVARRADKLKIPVIYGAEDKGKELLRFCMENNIQISKTVFIGNDLNDMPAFELAGFKGAPADAEEEIKAAADWVSKKNGGYGVIRDFYRDIMCAKLGDCGGSKT